MYYLKHIKTTICCWIKIGFKCKKIRDGEILAIVNYFVITNYYKYTYEIKYQISYRIVISDQWFNVQIGYNLKSHQNLTFPTNWSYINSYN